MNGLRAYELGLLTGLEKSGQRESVLKYAKKLEPLMKAAALLRKRGKSSPKLDKLAAWYEHIVPAIEKRADFGLSTAAAYALMAAAPWLLEKGYNWWTKPEEKPFTGFSPEMKKLMGKDFDLESISPIKLPKIGEQEQKYLQMYTGYSLPQLMAMKRQRSKHQAAYDKLTQQVKDYQTKPITGAEFFKRRPGVHQVMNMLPRDYYRSPSRPPPRSGGYRGEPRPGYMNARGGGWSGDIRRPYPRGPRPGEREFFSKNFMNTPGGIRSERDMLRTISCLTNQQQDFNKRFQRALGVEDRYPWS